MKGKKEEKGHANINMVVWELEGGLTYSGLLFSEL